MGNSVQGRETGTVADAGYYLHPHYRALVLRRNIADLNDWLAKAKEMYTPLGAEYTARPCEFRFPSGATIVVGHLDDEDAYMKYQGHEYARILIEELTQIPSEDLYMKLLVSNRTPYDELHRQVFVTANPGGPGGHWVRDRFVSIITPGETYTDPETERTRIFVPAGVKDNPIYSADKAYLGTLMALPAALRRAWLDGDWYAISGQYFEEFRVKPLQGEPPEACHVIDSGSAKLEPWYHRWAGADWGYGHNAALYMACQTPEGRIHIYNELSVNHTTPEEFGVQFAQMLWPDIQAGGQKTFSLYLPSDALAQKTSEKTIGDQIATGIQQILGPDSVYVIPLQNGDEPSVVFSRASLQQTASVVIQRANNQRVAGWMYLHSLLRWWPLLDGSQPFDPQFALKLYGEDRAKWREYCSIFKDSTEVLPRLLIHGDRCPKLVKAIPLAMAQDPDRGDPSDVVKNHWDGADELDACLVAGTYVLTRRGQLPIERIAVGDSVWTHNGWRRVLASGQTGIKPVVEVSLSDGTSLKGTANHPVWTGKEWTNLGDLWYNTRVWSRRWSLKVSSLLGIRIPPGCIREVTSGRASRPGENTGWVPFTEKFGRNLTDRFLRAIRSTIGMATPSTTSYRISNAYRRSNIGAVTGQPKAPSAAANGSPSLDPSLKSGMPPLPVENGIANTVGQSPQPYSLSTSTANIVAPPSSPRSEALSSAPTIASRPLAGSLVLTTKSAFAWLVAKALHVIDIANNAIAPVTVVERRDLGPESAQPVFNLSVDGDEEYFANGLLVHNCRYTCAAYQSIQVVEPFEEYFAKHMAKYGSENMSGDSKVQIARRAELKYKQLTQPLTAPLYWPRSASRQRRRSS